MRRLLITGASGFVGAACVEPLRARDFEIVAAGRRAPDSPGVEFHRCDLMAEDPAIVMRRVAPSHLLHLAWHDDHASIWDSPCNLAWVAATLRLALAFRDAGGERAVVAGSCAEYDWDAELLDEGVTALRPASLYGAAKKALYELLGRGGLDPVSVGWARIFFPFGPRDKPDRLLSQIIDGVSAGREVSCSHGQQIRPFLHVEDVGAALAALLDSGVEGAVNIAPDESCPVRKLALMAAPLAGDASLVRFGERPLCSREPLGMHAATSRLSREVGFRPRFGLEAGVADTVARRLEDLSLLRTGISHDR